MSNGSIDYSPPPAALASWPTALVVCRYDPQADPGQRYTALPNVYCEQIQVKDQSEPPTAQFTYILDDSGPWPFPSQFEQVWPIASPPNPYKVQAGDELVVLYVDVEGNYRVLWHGFAQLPQVDVAGRSQAIHFVGVSVHVRLWDYVIKGRWQRGGDEPDEPGDGEENPGPFQTDLPTRFNPDNKPNCTPRGADEEDEESGLAWPVFLEPSLQPKSDGTLWQTYWTLPKICKYLLWYYNDEEYVENPHFDILDDLLVTRKPKDGSQWYDLSDPSTYDEEPIVIRDYDATNRTLPDVLERQLEYAGFRLRFVTDGEESEGYDAGVIVEEPKDRLEIYRFDAAGITGPKQVSLQPGGATLDLSSSNVERFQAQNDFNALANQWTVETRPVRYEVAILLAPGFKPVAGDESPGTAKQWLASNQSSATKDVREKYRLWIADECGDQGHWNYRSKSWQEDSPPLLLGPVFQDPKTNPKGDYVARYRPGLNTLFSTDPGGKPYKAQLRVSRDYGDAEGALNPPCVWDGKSGTWQVIPNGKGWRLLKDRLGIFIEIDDPQSWDIGKPSTAAGNPAPQASDGMLNAVQCIANPNTSTDPNTPQKTKLFYLMLVCVIEGDQCIQAKAKKRPASPYPFTVERRVDAKDHFVKNVVDKSSPLRPSTAALVGGGAIVQPILDDDTDDAQSYADQMRSAREFPVIAAAITIPWFTRAYQPGDRISYIAGRDISLRQNAGGEQGEAANYPYVVGVTHIFSGGQKTILQLSDRRTEPPSFHKYHFSGRDRGRGQ